MRFACFVASVMIACVCGCTKSNEPSGNKNTNWLRGCDSEDECGAGLSCLCGICTKPCGTADQCTGGEGEIACVPVDGDLLASQCGSGGAEEAIAICLGACARNADCRAMGSEFVCVADRCLIAADAACASDDCSLDAGEGGVGIPDGSAPDADTGPPEPDSSLGPDADTGAPDPCDGGTCVLTCEPGLADCNQVASDGCETELLRDAGSCGQCGVACEAGASCIGGVCVDVLASDQESPSAIAVDATRVYWLNHGTVDALGNYQRDGSLRSAPLGGGEVLTLASNQDSPQALLIDDGSAYWVNRSLDTADAAIVQLPLSGGAPTPLTTGAHAYAMGLAVDDEHLYWTVPESNGTECALYRMLKDGSAQPERLLATGYYENGFVVVDEDSVAWTDQTHLWSAAKDGSAPTQLTTVDATQVLGLDASGIYFSMANGGEVRLLKAPSSGGSVTLAIEPLGLNVAGLAVTDEYVYWHYQEAEGGIGVLERTDKSPGESLELLRAREIERASLAVDAQSIYIAAEGEWGAATGAVFRLPRQ